MEQTTERRWHEIWLEQCEAAETIRLRHGVESAFDYVVGEKLLNFAEVAAEHREFAQVQLPQFVSRVRGMFTPEEMETHLARTERRRREMEETAVDDEDPGFGDDEATTERARQFDLVEGTSDRSGARHVLKPVAGRHQESSDREVLAGLVERVTFHNPENGFCVLRTRARGHRDLVTVVGHAAMVAAGEWITASGEWVNDRTHGQQFKARFIRTAAPSSVEGIEKYLGSGMIRGIGPVYARKLVRAFGEKVFDVIEAEPERLREVTGIGKVRADAPPGLL